MEIAVRLVWLCAADSARARAEVIYDSDLKRASGEYHSGAFEGFVAPPAATTTAAVVAIATTAVLPPASTVSPKAKRLTTTDYGSMPSLDEAGH
jgi:hypothetical protein